MKLHGLLERHPLSLDAQLLASGEYEYLCNDQAVPVFEPWVIFEKNAQRWVRSERIAAQGNVYIHVLARLDESAQVTSFEVSWHDWDSKALIVRGQYEYDQGVVRVARQQCNTADKKHPPLLENIRLALGPRRHAAPLFFPLLRIFMGGVISGLQAEGGEAEVVIPSIVDPANTDALLRPLVSLRRATPLNNTAADDVLCFEYLGDQYQTGSVFRFNRSGLLLGYQWSQDSGQSWQVRLINLEGRDDLFGFDLTASPSSGE